MKVSITGIALLSSLLAGALPLSAKDDVDQPHAPHSTTTHTTTAAAAAAEEETIMSSGQQESQILKNQIETPEEGESSSEVDGTTAAAAEAVHDDGKLYTLPPLPAKLLEEEETKKAEEAQHDSQEKQKQQQQDDLIKKAVDDAEDSEITTKLQMSGQEEEEEKTKSQEHIDSEDSIPEVGGDDLNNPQSQPSPPSEEQQQQQQASSSEDVDDNTNQSQATTAETIRNNEQQQQEEKQQEETQQEEEEEKDTSQSSSQDLISDSDQNEEKARETTTNEASSPATTDEKKQDDKNDNKEQEDDEEEDGRSRRVQVDYANKAAGALILEKSSSFKGASNLLLGDNDRYAISPCSNKNKYVIIGLSEDILVKTIKIANYERYSSPPKKFQVLGSSDMISFVDMGEFVAHSGNGEQAFELEVPVWARYLKFRFLTFYGAEHYCTVSQIKVHGSTMTQGFQEQYGTDSVEEEKQGDEDLEIDSGMGSGSESHGVDDGRADRNIGKVSDNDDSSTEDAKHQKNGQEKEESKDTDEREEKEEGSPTLSNASNDSLDDTVVSTEGHVGNGDADEKVKQDDTTAYKSNDNSSTLCKNEECGDMQPPPSQNADRNSADAAAENRKTSKTSVHKVDPSTYSNSPTITSMRASSMNRNSEIPHEVKELASLVVNLGAVSNDKGLSVGIDEEVVPEGGWQRTTPKSLPEEEKVQNGALLSSASPPPTPLTAADVFDDYTEMDILSSASIGTLSSAKSSSAEEEEEEGEEEDTTDLERESTASVSMKDASYAVKNVIRTVRQSASTTTVASAVKELQNIILTKIGPNTISVGVTGETKQISQSTAGSKGPEENLGSNDFTSGRSGSSAPTKSFEGRNDEEGSPKAASRHDDGDDDTDDDVHANEEGSKLGASVSDSVSQKKQPSQSTGTTTRSPHQNRGVDSTPNSRRQLKSSDGTVLNDVATDTFASLSQKFPSMACLDGLDYQEFRAKVSKAVGGSGSSGSVGGAGVGGAGGGGPPNRIEPIFKTLTDEIKSLQNTQSAHEHYVAALQGCYQQIVLDMARHIETVESSQEDRLAKLEGALRDLQKEQNTHWIEQMQRYASWVHDVVSAATEQVVPILLAAIGWCCTYGQMIFLCVEDFVSVTVSSLLDWLLRVVENEEVKTWLESVASMDKGTARQTAMFCCLVFWLVLTQIRLCRVQRRTKRSISLGRGEKVKMVHYRGAEITNNNASCPPVDGQSKVHRGDVHSHNIHDDMSCSDLSESETPLTPIEVSPNA